MQIHSSEVSSSTPELVSSKTKYDELFFIVHDLNSVVQKIQMDLQKNDTTQLFTSFDQFINLSTAFPLKGIQIRDNFGINQTDPVFKRYQKFLMTLIKSIYKNGEVDAAFEKISDPTIKKIFSENMNAVLPDVISSTMINDPQNKKLKMSFKSAIIKLLEGFIMANGVCTTLIDVDGTSVSDVVHVALNFLKF
uniref:Uncharacterized protein n=1 Tax=Panagrolaimus sp. ES5 TaxID=591445 RepID=A0AC34FC70_9BILA